MKTNGAMGNVGGGAAQTAVDGPRLDDMSDLRTDENDTTLKETKRGIDHLKLKRKIDSGVGTFLSSLGEIRQQLQPFLWPGGVDSTLQQPSWRSDVATDSALMTILRNPCRVLVFYWIQHAGVMGNATAKGLLPLPVVTRTEPCVFCVSRKVGSEGTASVTLGDIRKELPLGFVEVVRRCGAGRGNGIQSPSVLHFRFRTHVQSLATPESIEGASSPVTSEASGHMSCQSESRSPRGEQSDPWVDYFDDAEEVPLYGNRIFMKILVVPGFVSLPNAKQVVYQKSFPKTTLEPPLQSDAKQKDTQVAERTPYREENKHITGGAVHCKVTRHLGLDLLEEECFGTGSSPPFSPSTNVRAVECTAARRESTLTAQRDRVESKLLEYKIHRSALEDAAKARLEASETLGDEMDRWALNNDKTLKDARTLITTLQDVLWPNHDWKAISMADVVVMQPDTLKKVFRLAIRFCHPDKHHNSPPAIQYRAHRVFQALNESFKTLQQKQPSAIAPTLTR